MHFDIDKHTIFKTVTGSHAYGMATPTSDIDVRGVAIAPKSTVAGFAYNFEQYEDKENDIVIYDIRKFFQLATKNNPNIIELLFIDEKHWQYHNTFWSMHIHPHRHLFLNKGCHHRYTGYAHAQLKRIKTHKQWLLDPPKEKPLRANYGLPEQKKLTNDERGALNKLIEDDYDIGKEIMAYLVQEKQYQAHLNQWKQYSNWKKHRNPARAELEQKYGYDTKHASHLIRLLKQGIEILQTHDLVIGRQEDAEELLAIRTGLYSYDELMEVAQKLEETSEKWYNKSALRNAPDIKTINQLCVKAQEDFWEIS